MMSFAISRHCRCVRVEHMLGCRLSQHTVILFAKSVNMMVGEHLKFIKRLLVVSVYYTYIQMRSYPCKVGIR